MKKIFYRVANCDVKELGKNYARYENIKKRGFPQIKIIYNGRYLILDPQKSKKFDKDLEIWLNDWDTILKLRNFYNNDKCLYITKKILLTYAKEIL